MAERKSVRLRNTVTGVVVQVREDKVLGSEWEPVEKKPAPAPKQVQDKTSPKSTK